VENVELKKSDFSEVVFLALYTKAIPNSKNIKLIYLNPASLHCFTLTPVRVRFLGTLTQTVPLTLTGN